VKKQLYVIMNSDDRYYMGIVVDGVPQFGGMDCASKLSFEDAQERASKLELEGYPCYVELI
jgi:hypothetical protein